MRYLKERTCPCTSSIIDDHNSLPTRLGFPSPYHDPDHYDATKRNIEWELLSEPHRSLRVVWNLRGLLKQWHESDDDETWPWVWCQHNPDGLHHVFVNVGADTLIRIRAIAKSDDAKHGCGMRNVTVIAESREAIEKYCSLQDLYDARCAVVVGQAPLQIDTGAKILMLEDERIVCFDELVVA